MKRRTIQTKKGSCTLIEPGIVQFSIKENIEWTLEDAKETHQANLELNNGKKFCVYMNASHFFVPTREAQKFITTKECTEHYVGSAFVLKNAGLKILANLFIKFFKSRSPSRVFNSEEKALQWMRKVVKEAREK